MSELTQRAENALERPLTPRMRRLVEGLLAEVQRRRIDMDQLQAALDVQLEQVVPELQSKVRELQPLADDRNDAHRDAMVNRDTATALQAKIDTVRKLHRPIPATLSAREGERLYCPTCATRHVDIQEWPCPTAKALGEL